MFAVCAIVFYFVVALVAFAVGVIASTKTQADAVRLAVQCLMKYDMHAGVKMIGMLIKNNAAVSLPIALPRPRTDSEEIVVAHDRALS